MTHLFDLGGPWRDEVSPFGGMTFHEVHAKTMLNRLAGATAGGMGWTLNPYRGCAHGCTYCFARTGHQHLGFGITEDFSKEIVVKTNAAEVLRAELRRGRVRDDWVMVGTSTDCYQRAEGRYRLMPDILRVLAEHRIRFTTTTKSALLLRDTELFARAAERAEVLVMTSLGSLDDRVRRVFEPAASPPKARLHIVRTLRAAGIPAGVLIAPIIPHAGDHPAALDALVDACVEAGAVTVFPDVMRIKTALRPWFLEQAAATVPPDLARRLTDSYGRHRSMPDDYIGRVTAHVHARARRHGLPIWSEYIAAHSAPIPQEERQLRLL
ncbi:radical SAM protein [Nocardia terpenica]|uniref:radical SAM protein n=1 Tax=Nocardia terpenica TaxID=455432 RepID=UPI0018930356|nr:radical SAM protein [Nocardia terpenica]MBF6065339.1 radical SAM protein [Nocardia terpenica]MBF6108911.1 radical SAM protein [Nocardia terpenica]MBF6121754.1 radical SAM protein [Nocardia terpenica]